jgi:hypothetical protein
MAICRSICYKLELAMQLALEMQGTSIHKMTQGLLKGIEAKPRICKNLMSLLKSYQNSPVSLYYSSDHWG